MRSGFTTGSCAAAASKAAAFMLFSQTKKQKISIITPAGITYSPEVEILYLGKDYVSCGIVKDGGDDPDATSGALICSKVSLCDSEGIKIIGGIGVGRVTRKGLEQPVGSPAINSVPQSMILSELKEVMELFDYNGGLLVEIFVPEGEEIAQKTFNPHMGIEGGISILGTTGIVEPMSSQALIKTIELDLKQKYEEGNKLAILVPGNYGESFLKNEYGITPERIVHFSNYMGIAIDLACQIGFKKILVVGHTGKLVKVSGGIMNTHSKEADSRLELMAAALIEAANKTNKEIGIDLLQEILSQMTTTGALELIQDIGLLEEVSQVLVSKILYHLRKRAIEGVEVECILYENSFGLLAKSDFNLEELL